MAIVDILAAFSYKWAQDGTASALDDAQYKVGWSFIGATPPSVEQFNKVHQVADEKSNWLYGNMAAVFTAAGISPTAGNLLALRDALRAAGVFQTAAPGNSSTLAATTAFVGAAIAAASGRLTRTLVYRRIAGVQNVSIDGGAFTTSGASTYTRGASVSFAEIEAQGAGGAGGGAGGATAGNVSLGAPGTSGAYGIGRFTAATIGASAMVVTCGAGGVPVSNAAGGVGGTSAVGALITAIGGTGGGIFNNQAPPVVNGNGAGPSAVGANMYSASGSATIQSFAVSSSALIPAGGGASMFGPGPIGPAGNTNGISAANYGTGGSGVALNSTGGTATGGAGADGIVIIREFS